MITHDLVQGSAEWHAYRAAHFNASDAPAMMGLSAYTTRQQLLNKLHTGYSPEVDSATQRRFDDGHRFEALARPLAEKIIGEELYPVVGSDGELSASFDGLTMAEDQCFEHKALNDSLRTVMFDGCTGADLPPMYRIQMEQQLMVSGASRCLFMASKWDSDNLIEERHCWYYPDLELRQQIIDGWKQFASDLAIYVPATVEAKPVGKTPETLPALHIEVTGMVTASNLESYKAHALSVFAGINRELTTDAHFADAEKVVKWCGDVEDRLQAAKQHALSQTESIDQLFKAIDDITAEAKRTRLELDKLVKGRKEAIRSEIIAEANAALRDHIITLNKRIGKQYMPAVLADFAGVIKGKRSIDSIRDAVSSELARAKIESSSIADRIQINLETKGLNGYGFLFADIAMLCTKANDDFQNVVTARITAHEAKEAAAVAERERVRREDLERIVADAAKVERIVTAPDIAPARVTVVSLPVRAPFPSAAPSLRLGQICERLGFTLTADFLTGLGYPPAATDKNAKLYHQSDFGHICAAIVNHINSIQASQAA